MTLEQYLQQQYTPKTATAYGREIQAYLQNQPGAAVAMHKDIANYLGALRKRYGNPATLNRILCSIKAYYSYLHASGKRKDNPSRSIKLRDKQSRDIQLQDLFTAEELEKLLDRKERYTVLTYRNRVLMGLLVYQGLLPAELENLKTNDVNLDRGSIYIRGTPKTNSRELQLKPEQIMLFHEYLSQVRPKLLKDNESEALLIGSRQHPVTSEDITKQVTRSFKGLYAPRKVNCRTIRQSVITNLLRAGNDLRIVQVFAGHKYPSATEKYKQAQLEELKVAVQKHHPLG
ncbi:tyrosine-type recombinase/integrase [Cyclobacterium sp. SYSU L10401]|uniref:tyrosine-type recombinase/integrase n=1 Tax=Cyclobacterium sp. SYSU L10401 TaxID=2678657 RepID=UPI0013D4EF8F|nr:tyrosine-type recombinase/integrase [Cyclobacterium sp. SYSU L10401]